MPRWIVWIMLLLLEACDAMALNRHMMTVVVDQQPLLCFLDGCMLICHGDIALMNLCESIDHSAMTDCALDGCDLVCRTRDHQTIQTTIHPSVCSIQTSRLRGTQRPLLSTTSERRLSNDASSDLWPQGRICYQTDATVSPMQSEVVVQAIQHWTNQTNLTFLPCDSVDECTMCAGEGQPFLQFVAQRGCWSSIGRQASSRIQLLSVGGCGYGQIVHEVGHAVGLKHEHVRSDRDQYVRVLTNNILPLNVADFTKDLGFLSSRPYDYASIMHYGLFTFSKNGKATLVPIDQSQQMNLSIRIGQRTALSEGDVATVQALYGPVWNN